MPESQPALKNSETQITAPRTTAIQPKTKPSARHETTFAALGRSRHIQRAWSPADACPQRAFAPPRFRFPDPRLQDGPRPPLAFADSRDGCRARRLLLFPC